MTGISSTQLTYTVTTLANILAQELTEEELNLLASVLVALSDTLFLIIADRNFRKT